MTISEDRMANIDDLESLIGFLGSSRPDVRLAAAEAVASLTEDPGFIAACSTEDNNRQSRDAHSTSTTEVNTRDAGEQETTEDDKQDRDNKQSRNVEGRQKATPIGRTATKLLLNNIGVELKLSSLCLSALINLCDCLPIHVALLDMHAIRRLMDNLRDQHRGEAPRHEALNVMLLANLTRSERGKLQFLGCEGDNKRDKPSTLSDLFVQRLIREFLKDPTPSPDGQFPDQYLWVGHLLVNITSHALGRKCMLMGSGAEGVVATINALSKQLFLTHLGSTLDRSTLDRRGLMLQVFLHLAADHTQHQWLMHPICLFVPSLCCLVYPPVGSLRKVKAENLLKQSGCLVSAAGPGGTMIDDQSERCQKQLQEQQPEEGISLNSKEKVDLGSKEENAATEAVKMEEELNSQSAAGVVIPDGHVIGRGADDAVRVLDKFIDEHAIGLIKSKEARTKIFESLSLVASSEIGREGLRRLGVYEVLRVWHLLEEDETIIHGIEDMVHLLVYSEEELKEQDAQLKCSG